MGHPQAYLRREKSPADVPRQLLRLDVELNRGVAHSRAKRVSGGHLQDQSIAYGPKCSPLTRLAREWATLSEFFRKL